MCGTADSQPGIPAPSQATKARGIRGQPPSVHGRGESRLTRTWEVETVSILNIAFGVVMGSLALAFAACFYLMTQGFYP